MKADTTILVTVHGSHLYGLNKIDSDLDFFRVVEERKKPRNFVRDGFDYLEIGLEDFLRNVFNGSHQSCEALWSPLKFVHEEWKPLFQGFRVTGADAFARYRRTIAAFSHGDVKKRRHAVRLAFNLADLQRYGRFNPVLTEDQRTSAVMLAELYQGDTLVQILSKF